ncbi:MAG: dihydrofolate reductase [Nonlabens sp.]
MLGSRKKERPTIDPEQKELIENAQRRIKQKRRLFTHFVVFLVASVGLIIISKVLMTGTVPAPLGVEWWIWIVFLWLLLLIYHAFNVFVTRRLLGPEWEKRQYEKLVDVQKKRIAKLEDRVQNEFPLTNSHVLKASKNAREITMIAAVDGNMGIGKDNDLVWRLPDDFKRFKQLTTGHHIIMGRKTFESFPKPLPNRTHIVITRDEGYTSQDAIIVHDMNTAIAAAGDDPQPFIIGGGEIYKLGLAVAHKLELTRIHHVFDVDTYFPEFSKKNWKLISSQHHAIDDRHEYAFDFETWERK